MLGSNLLRRLTDSYSAMNGQNAKFDRGKSLLVTGFDCNGRVRLCKSFCSDRDQIGNSWRDVVECKRSIVLCYNCERIADRLLQDYRRVGNRIVVTVDHCSKDASCSGILRFRRLSECGCNENQSVCHDDEQPLG